MAHKLSYHSTLGSRVIKKKKKKKSIAASCPLHAALCSAVTPSCFFFSFFITLEPRVQ